MKKLFLSLIAVAAMAMAFTHVNDNKGLARVQKILGKEVYVLCEPVRDYEIVEKMNTSLTTMAIGRTTIQKQMQEVINRAHNRVEKGKLGEFDAAMTDDGDVIVLIKFKD